MIRRGKKRTLIAAAHRMFIDIYFIPSTGEPYQDMGAKAVHERTIKKNENSMIKSFEIA
jgi:hypothetical protein